LNASLKRIELKCRSNGKREAARHMKGAEPSFWQGAKIFGKSMGGVLCNAKF